MLGQAAFSRRPALQRGRSDPKLRIGALQFLLQTSEEEKPMQRKAPRDYEALIRLIHERHDRMSKTYQAIAVYLTQNPNDIAINSVTAIAGRCGIHASSFVRFAQALGYDGFKELQALFQKRLATAAPGFEARVKALESELHTREDRLEFC